MSKTDGSATNGPAETATCFARAVVNVLNSERSLEAVTIDRDQQTISVATLGQTDVSGLTARIASDFNSAQSFGTPEACGLLSGAGDCARCATPLDAAELQQINIRTEAHRTTIARVTCPTAPK